MKKNQLFSFATKSIMMLWLGASIGTAALAQNRSTLKLEGKEASREIAEATYIMKKSADAAPSFVRLNKEARITEKSFEKWIKQTMKWNENVGFAEVKKMDENKQSSHITLQQTLDGKPIDGMQYRLHIKNGVIEYFNGNVWNNSNPPQSKSISLSEQQALKRGLEASNVKKGKWEVPYWEEEIRIHKKSEKATYYPKGSLVWLANDGNLELHYKFDISAAIPDKEFRMYVHVQTGKITKTVSLESFCHATTVNTVFNGNRAISTDKYTATNFRLRDNCDAAVIHIRNWGNDADCTNNLSQEIENDDNVWTTQNEIFGGSVLWCIKRAHFYWKDKYSRDSYDDANGNINGYINAKFDGCGTSNASMSFTGGTLKVGIGVGTGLDDSRTSLDVMGHEYAHAVTSATANLEYSGESGALNESFSDILGQALDRHVTGSNTWLHGSLRSSGHIRSFINPNEKNQPDTYLGTNWGTGVHTNSGVQNFWFYLLTNGGTGTNDNSESYSVDAIGFDKAELIAVRNLLFQLSQFSNYADAREGSIAVATDLYGACSREVIAVTNAWHAVGVGDRFPEINATTFAPLNEVCQGGSIQLQATGAGIGGFSWTGPNGFSRNGATPTINNIQPNRTGWYVVSRVLPNECVGKDSVYILVNPKPILVTHNPSAVCSPSLVNITTAAITAGSVPANMSLAYFTNAVATIPLANPSSISQLGSKLYYLVGTDNKGCKDTTNILVTVNTKPTVVTYNPPAVCAPQTVNITAPILTYGSTPNLTYSYWRNAACTITESNPTAISNGNTYYVRGVNASGCSDTTPMVVTINPCGMMPLSKNNGNNAFAQDGMDVWQTIAQNSLKIYPNPAKDVVYFEFEAAVSGELQYNITDGLSRTVSNQQTFKIMPGINKLAIDVSGLANGLYYFRFFTHTANNNGVIKLVVSGK